MIKKISFSELREIKNKLPEGSTHLIAKELGLKVETVRNYFGGQNFTKGKSVGFHKEEGCYGGVVELDDSVIINKAYKILEQNNITI